MKTDDLIQSLSSDLKPVQSGLIERRFALGAFAGVVVSTVLLVFWLGVRPDIWLAIGTAPFISREAYAVSLSAIALVACLRLMRPELKLTKALLAIVIPVFCFAIFAAAELVSAPLREWGPLALGHDVFACVWRIFAISTPILAGMLWAYRAFAPSDERAAGGAIGLAAGSIGAALYGFHCTESAASFVFLWYSASIAAMTLAGGLAGRFLLRW